MPPLTNILANASRKASRLLHRDYIELEMLQSSNKSVSFFCLKSIQRTKEILFAEIGKYHQHIYFADSNDINQVEQQFIWINPIEGFTNFSRSLPFFAILISYCKKLNDKIIVTNSLINFPALGEIFYAKKGGGAWREKISLEYSSNASRLRINNNKLIEEVVGVDDSKCIKQNVRHFGSFCYEVAQFACGKIDFLKYYEVDNFIRANLELITIESGGFIGYNDLAFIAAGEKIIDSL